MKRRILLIFLLIILASLAILSEEFIVGAESVEEELDKNIDDKLSSLDLTKLESYFQKLSVENNTLGSSFKALLKRIISGEQPFTFTAFLEVLLKGFSSQIVSVLPFIIGVVLISILSSMLSGLTYEYKSKSVTNVVNIACYIAICTLLSVVVFGAVKNTKEVISSMITFMEIVFPILITLVSGLGGVSTLAACQPMMVVLTTVIAKIIYTVVLPLFIACYIFLLVGNINKNIKLNKFYKLMKSAGEWILKIIFSLFGIFLTFQGITGSIFDSVSIGATRFALSSYVPILGGYLSKGFDLIMASVVLIKNGIGMITLIILLITILLPICKLIVLIFGLKIAAAIVEPISNNDLNTMLYDLSKALPILISCILGVAFMFLLIVMILICSCNVGVY